MPCLKIDAHILTDMSPRKKPSYVKKYILIQFSHTISQHASAYVLSCIPVYFASNIMTIIDLNFLEAFHTSRNKKFVTEILIKSILLFLLHDKLISWQVALKFSCIWEV